MFDPEHRFGDGFLNRSPATHGQLGRRSPGNAAMLAALAIFMGSLGLGITSASVSGPWYHRLIIVGFAGPLFGGIALGAGIAVFRNMWPMQPPPELLDVCAYCGAKRAADGQCPEGHGGSHCDWVRQPPPWFSPTASTLVGLAIVFVGFIISVSALEREGPRWASLGFGVLGATISLVGVIAVWMMLGQFASPAQLWFRTRPSETPGHAMGTATALRRGLFCMAGEWVQHMPLRPQPASDIEPVSPTNSASERARPPSVVIVATLVAAGVATIHVRHCVRWRRLGDRLERAESRTTLLTPSDMPHVVCSPADDHEISQLQRVFFDSCTSSSVSLSEARYDVVSNAKRREQLLTMTHALHDQGIVPTNDLLSAVAAAPEHDPNESVSPTQAHT